MEEQDDDDDHKVVDSDQDYACACDICGHLFLATGAMMVMMTTMMMVMIIPRIRRTVMWQSLFLMDSCPSALNTKIAKPHRP